MFDGTGASKVLKLLDERGMGGHNEPGFLDRAATVLEPEGAPVNPDLLEIPGSEEVLKQGNFPTVAKSRPLKRHIAISTQHKVSNINKGLEDEIGF